jgi:starch synthase (maltosyl-transferring)
LAPERAPRSDMELARKRVIIEGVAPEIDGGRFPVKRTVGDRLRVEADIVADGHEVLAAELLFRRAAEPDWQVAPLRPLVNDRWRGEFTVTELGGYHYTLQAWIDRFRTWQRDLQKKVEAGQNVAVELLMGPELVAEAQPRAARRDAEALGEWAAILRQAGEQADRVEQALDRGGGPGEGPVQHLVRDVSPLLRPGSGTARHLSGLRGACPTSPVWASTCSICPPSTPSAAPTARAKTTARWQIPEDVGSPWAIGAAEGGTRRCTRLGTLEDFRRLVARARESRLEVALDIAFQGSPDHPYVREHPQWFRWRPDNTVQYAENPPRNTRTFIPLISRPRTGAALWKN